MTELRCNEKLNRASPELWPEPLPGISQFSKSLNSIDSYTPSIIPVKFKADLDLQDVKYVNNLGTLSVDQLLDKMNRIQNDCYTLGVEEAREISKGKFLQILQPANPNQRYKF